jgi:hypothetical protein
VTTARRDDVVVVENDQRMTRDELRVIGEQWKATCPDVRLVILAPGMHAQILHPGAKTRRHGYTPRWAR